MGRKMVIRILSISIALLFLGMLFPGLTKADISTDKPDNLVDFEKVLIGSSETIVLAITNLDEQYPIQLILNLSGGADCGISYDTDLQQEVVGVGQTVSLPIIYEPEPSGPDSCSGTLRIYYLAVCEPTPDNPCPPFEFPYLDVEIKGMGVSAPSTVIIDGLDTGVENKTYQGKTVSYWLDELAAEARNHGQYVRGVALMVRKMHKANVLSKEDMKVIMKTAAHAKIPKEGVIKSRKAKHHRGRHAGGFRSHGDH